MHYLNSIKKKNILIIFLLLLSYSGSVNAEWYDYLNPLVSVRALLNFTIVRPTLAVWHYAGFASVAYVEQRAAQSLAHVEQRRQETALAIRADIDPLARRIEAANRNTQEQHGILARLKSDFGRAVRADFRANRTRAAQSNYRFARMCSDINQCKADFDAALEQNKQDNQKSAGTLSTEHKKIEQELQLARVDLQNHRCDVQPHLEQQAQNEAASNGKIAELEKEGQRQGRLAINLEKRVDELAEANDELAQENEFLRFINLLLQKDIIEYNGTSGKKVSEAAAVQETEVVLEKSKELSSAAKFPEPVGKRVSFQAVKKGLEDPSAQPLSARSHNFSATVSPYHRITTTNNN
jgi:hypothetical protein